MLQVGGGLTTNVAVHAFVHPLASTILHEYTLVPIFVAQTVRVMLVVVTFVVGGTPGPLQTIV